MARCLETGKVKYGKLGAAFAIAKIQRQDNPDHKERRAYYCRSCKQYHLTSKRDWKEEN